VGATSISHEHGTRTLEFLSSQALTRKQIWVSKALASAAFLIGVLVMCLIFHRAIRPFHVYLCLDRSAAPISATLTPSQIWTIAWGLPVVSFAIAFFCSTVLDKAIVALGASGVLSLVMLPLMAYLSDQGHRMISMGRVAISSWLLSLGFMGASFLVFCRHELWQDGRAALKATVGGTACLLLTAALTPISCLWDRLPPASEIHEMRALAGARGDRTVFEAVDRSGRFRLWNVPSGWLKPQPLTGRQATPILIPNASGAWPWHMMTRGFGVPCLWRGRPAVVDCRTRAMYRPSPSASDFARGLVARHARVAVHGIDLIAHANPEDAWGSPFLAGLRDSGTPRFFWGNPLIGSVRSIVLGPDALTFVPQDGELGRFAIHLCPDGDGFVAQERGSTEIWLVSLQGQGRIKLGMEGTVQSVQWAEPRGHGRQPMIIVRLGETGRASLWLHETTLAHPTGIDHLLIRDAANIRSSPGSFLVRQVGQDDAGLWTVRGVHARCLVPDGLRDAPLQCGQHWHDQGVWVFIRNGRELWRMDEGRKRPFKIWPRVVSPPSRDSAARERNS